MSVPIQMDPPCSCSVRLRTSKTLLTILKLQNSRVWGSRSAGGRSVGRWFAGFHRFTLKPKSVDSRRRRRRTAARPSASVDHIASIGDFGWDDGMARRKKKKKKTAWHGMAGMGREGGEKRGPEAMMQRQTGVTNFLGLGHQTPSFDERSRSLPFIQSNNYRISFPS